ncbi:MAG: GNAT family N-acetyltransferase [Chloroflexi bacterium]|nr:GNAT family N-acetyltransferase [Chloroflexota bacterium]
MTAAGVTVQAIDAGDLAPALAVAASALPLAASERRLLGPGQPFLHQGVRRAFVARTGTGVAVRLVASLDPRQRAAGGAVGAIGFIAGDDPAALGAALDAGAAWLASAGAAVVRAPLQLSTWYSHRAITVLHPALGGMPPFPLEPVTGVGLPAVLAAGGYRPASEAVSLVADPRAVVADTRQIVARLHRAGFAERPFNPARPVEELARLHRLTADAFAGSWGFTPIEEDEFQHAFAPLVASTDPAFVRFLLDPAGQPVGFIFALMAGETLVVKTLAVAPDVRRQHPGFGLALAGVAHELAVARGATRAIHALMAVGSTSARIAGRWGTPLRRYATFERVLTGGIA